MAVSKVLLSDSQPSFHCFTSHHLGGSFSSCLLRLLFFFLFYFLFFLILLFLFLSFFTVLQVFAFVGETVDSSCTKERDVLGVIAQTIGQQGLDL